jgi:hypothetical protein
LKLDRTTRVVPLATPPGLGPMNQNLPSFCSSTGTCLGGPGTTHPGAASSPTPGPPAPSPAPGPARGPDDALYTPLVGGQREGGSGSDASRSGPRPGKVSAPSHVGAGFETATGTCEKKAFGGQEQFQMVTPAASPPAPDAASARIPVPPGPRPSPAPVKGARYSGVGAGPAQARSHGGDRAPSWVGFHTEGGWVCQTKERT